MLACLPKSDVGFFLATLDAIGTFNVHTRGLFGFQTSPGVYVEGHFLHSPGNKHPAPPPAALLLLAPPPAAWGLLAPPPAAWGLLAPPPFLDLLAFDCTSFEPSSLPSSDIVITALD
jgi:hypothetical protein